MKKTNPLIACMGLMTIFLLYLPLVAVVIFSVNDTRLGYTWRGFTLKWYAELFSNEDIMEAGRNTLILALVSTAISTVLGTLLALSISRFPWPKPAQRFFDAMIYLPVVMPDIVFAAAMVAIFSLLRIIWSIFDPGLLPMIIAHVTFQIAFVALVVQSRLATLGRTIDEAARDLYASNWYVMRRITLPLLAPGIVAGAMLAFTLSLDDFVISFFTRGPDSTTLPLLIYAAVRRSVTPEIHALSTLIILVTVALVLGLERLTRRGRT